MAIGAWTWTTLQVVGGVYLTVLSCCCWGLLISYFLSVARTADGCFKSLSPDLDAHVTTTSSQERATSVPFGDSQDTNSEYESGSDNDSVSGDSVDGNRRARSSHKNISNDFSGSDREMDEENCSGSDTSHRSQNRRGTKKRPAVSTFAVSTKKKTTLTSVALNSYRPLKKIN